MVVESLISFSRDKILSSNFLVLLSESLKIQDADLAHRIERVLRLRTDAHHVDRCGTQIADLAPLAGLSQLQRLDCSHSQVADLAPLAGLKTLLVLFCSDTQVADLRPLAGLGALRALHEGGVRVPAEIRVVGFDNLAQGAYAVPSLTSVDVPVLDMVRFAFATLVELITEIYWNTHFP